MKVMTNVTHERSADINYTNSDHDVLVIDIEFENDLNIIINDRLEQIVKAKDKVVTFRFYVMKSHVYRVTGQQLIIHKWEEYLPEKKTNEERYYRRPRCYCNYG